jgi:hypothetical protein
MIKLGLDFHGCADTYPEVYGPLTQLLVTGGHEVHIVTGVIKTDEIVEQLQDLKVWWTHWFSIAQHHLDLGDTEVRFVNGTPWMDKGIWDSAKANYCEREGINVMIDNCPAYGSYFTGETVFLLQKELRAQEAWMLLAGRIGN